MGLKSREKKRRKKTPAGSWFCQRRLGKHKMKVRGRHPRYPRTIIFKCKCGRTVFWNMDREEQVW